VRPRPPVFRYPAFGGLAARRSAGAKAHVARWSERFRRGRADRLRRARRKSRPGGVCRAGAEAQGPRHARTCQPRAGPSRRRADVPARTAVTSRAARLAYCRPRPSAATRLRAAEGSCPALGRLDARSAPRDVRGPAGGAGRRGRAGGCWPRVGAYLRLTSDTDGTPSRRSTRSARPTSPASAGGGRRRSCRSSSARHSARSRDGATASFPRPPRPGWQHAGT